MSGTTKGLQLRSLIKKSGELELSLAEVPIPEPGPDQVLVKVEATPINPSDLGLLLGPADMSTAKASGSGAAIKITAKVPEQALPFIAARLDQAMPVGNEGAGTVIKASSSEAAQALLGKTVSMIGGAMYAQYRLLKATDCQPLPAGTTAAASNLGQMLNKICQEDGIGLVNIVRSAEQAKLLYGIGAKHVIVSTSTTFTKELTQALVETGATIAFDAIGGGKLASQILTCMEVALSKTAKEYSRYGSTTHKQVYIYGSLNTAPVELMRNYGMAWGVGGWLLTPFLQKIGRSEQVRLRERVVKSLKTTFASHYTKTVSLTEALDLANIAVYGKRATGEKYLINPNKA